MQNTKLYAVVEYLLDNIFDLLTIGVAGFLVIKYQINKPETVDLPEITTWVLAVLGLVAVSGLWERNRRLHRIEKLSLEGRDLSRRFLNKKVYADDFFLSDKKLNEKDFASANSIYFVGKTLTRTTREFFYVMGQRLIAGAHLRFMILDPDNELLMNHVALQGFDAPVEYWRDTLRTVEKVVDAISKTPGSTGKVEIAYLPFVPSFGMVLIDPDQPNGKNIVELYHHKSPTPNPIFELNAIEDVHWYKFFRDQYEILWRSCRQKTFPEG